MPHDRVTSWTRTESPAEAKLQASVDGCIVFIDRPVLMVVLCLLTVRHINSSLRWTGSGTVLSHLFI